MKIKPRTPRRKPASSSSRTSSSRKPAGRKINTEGTTTGRASGTRPSRSNVPKSTSRSRKPATSEAPARSRTRKTEPTETPRSKRPSKQGSSGVGKRPRDGKVLGIKLHQTSVGYTADAMREYGSEVVEQRAIPDYRDGLKPVQRMALWAMYKLGIHNNGGYKKSARTVGDVIGKYHPHGDQSVYQAIVGITGTKFQGKREGWATRNCSTPLVEGQGNWGDFIDDAAAMRYSECKLSKFSDLMLLDPDYLAVMDYVPNYDDSEKVPVLLPAKLPVVLLNGFSSIAVGVSGKSPPFHINGVLELTRRALRGEDITIKDCVKNLKFDFPYGGVCISEKRELVPLFKGKGSAAFMPEYELSSDKKTLTFKNVCPGLMSAASVEKFQERLSNVKGVAHVDDDTSKYGARYVVTFARTITGQALETAIDACLDESVRTDDYDIGITVRDPKGRATFKRSNVPEMLKLWAEWRIDVEVKVLNRLIGIQEQAKARQELFLLAVDNLDIIIKSLKVKEDKVEVKVMGKDPKTGKQVPSTVTVDGSAAYLMKALKLTVEQANLILDRKVRQLRAMERNSILARIKEHKAELKRLNADLKVPHERVLRNLDGFEKVVL